MEQGKESRNDFEDTEVEIFKDEYIHLSENKWHAKQNDSGVWKTWCFSLKKND